MIDLPIFVSLGSACRTRFQIDQYLKSISPNYVCEFHFFDRLMAGGLPGVINLIKRDFRLSQDGFEIVEVAGEYFPRDAESKMTFSHDFGSRHNTWHNPSDCWRAMVENMSDSLALYSNLAARTSSLLASKREVCLVYHGSSSAENFDELHDVLKKKYRRSFLIANILESGAPATARTSFAVTRYVFDTVNPKIGSPQEWEGCNESWSSALSSIAIKPRRLSIFSRMRASQRIRAL